MSNNSILLLFEFDLSRKKSYFYTRKEVSNKNMTECILKLHLYIIYVCLFSVAIAAGRRPGTDTGLKC